MLNFILKINSFNFFFSFFFFCWRIPNKFQIPFNEKKKKNKNRIFKVNLFFYENNGFSNLYARPRIFISLIINYFNFEYAIEMISICWRNQQFIAKVKMEILYDERYCYIINIVTLSSYLKQNEWKKT